MSNTKREKIALEHKKLIDKFICVKRYLVCFIELNLWNGYLFVYKNCTSKFMHNA